MGGWNAERCEPTQSGNLPAVHHLTPREPFGSESGGEVDSVAPGILSFSLVEVISPRYHKIAARKRRNPCALKIGIPLFNTHTNLPTVLSIHICYQFSGGFCMEFTVIANLFL